MWTDHPNFFDEECDYRYVTDCSAWVYHPYFVLYNNLDQEIGPPNFENVVAPLQKLATYAAENFQLLEGTPDQGNCPWTPLGAQPPDPQHIP